MLGFRLGSENLEQGSKVTSKKAQAAKPQGSSSHPKAASPNKQSYTELTETQRRILRSFTGDTTPPAITSLNLSAALKRSDSGSTTDFSASRSDSERSFSTGSDSPRSTKSDSELSVKQSQSQPSFVRQFSEKLTEAFSKLVRSATEPLPQKGLARTGG